MQCFQVGSAAKRSIYPRVDMSEAGVHTKPMIVVQTVTLSVSPPPSLQKRPSMSSSSLSTHDAFLRFPCRSLPPSHHPCAKLDTHALQPPFLSARRPFAVPLRVVAPRCRYRSQWRLAPVLDRLCKPSSVGRGVHF